MPVPFSQGQVRLLLSIQRLLSEGLFTATYKYALLLALADLAVESGDDSVEPLTIETTQIAEKFIGYYWRQVVPCLTEKSQGGIILRPNADRQAAVVRIMAKAREKHGEAPPAVQRDGRLWPSLVKQVARVVCAMPLWKLRVVGRGVFIFLYEHRGSGHTITLRPGVAYCFRPFHPLITELVRGVWVRYIRQQNLAALGDTADLSELLFGSERADLAADTGHPLGHDLGELVHRLGYVHHGQFLQKLEISLRVRGIGSGSLGSG